MGNNNYKKWDNIRRGVLQVHEADSVYAGSVNVAPGVTLPSLVVTVNGQNVVNYPDNLPCKIIGSQELVSFITAPSNNGKMILNSTGGYSSINITGNFSYPSSSDDYLLYKDDGIYYLSRLCDAMYPVQANWSTSNSASPSYIRNKPSVEVTGNKLTSSQTIDTYKANTTKYPTTKAVYDFVTSSLQSYVPDVSGKEDTSNKTNDISSNNTSTTKYPSAKGVYDFVSAAVEPVQTINANSTSTEIPSAAAVWAKVQELQQSINNIRPLYPMSDSWFDDVTNMTQLAQKINADATATEGKLYVGTIRLKGLPSGIQQGEVKAEIMKVFESGDKNILFTLTSVNVSPYHWERTWVNSSGFLDNKWIAFSSSKVNETT